MTTKPQAWPGAMKETTAIPFYLMPDSHLARCVGHHISATCLTPYGESYTEKDTKKSLTILTTFSWLAQLTKNVRKPLHYLIHLIRKLGLHVSWTKVIGPTQHVTFLGVDIDTVECTLSLGHGKLRKVQGIPKTFKAKRGRLQCSCRALLAHSTGRAS